MAGVEYLQHALSPEQLALYRVAAQDAHRVPELGRRYRDEVIERRNVLFGRSLGCWAAAKKWKVRDTRGAGNVFAGLLRAGMFEDALHGLREFSEAEINAQARWAAGKMLILLRSGDL